MNVPGDVVAYDARSGQAFWRFNTVPKEGELGVDTWLGADGALWDVPVDTHDWVGEHPELLDASWKYTGNVGHWAPVTADEQLGLFYVPTETPTNDYFGGYRPGENLFGNSVVALDAETGERVWHFQLTHHELWDYDLPTAPILVDMEVDGVPVKALVQLSKQGFAYVLDRATGEPIWPIEEREVQRSDVPGEWTSLTQPFPTRPPPFERQGIREDDLIDFTPELRAAALRAVQNHRLGPLYTPPSLVEPDGTNQGTLALPGAGGGANWPGGGGRSRKRYPLRAVTYGAVAVRVGGGHRRDRSALPHITRSGCSERPRPSDREASVRPDHRNRSDCGRDLVADSARKHAQLYPRPSGPSRRRSADNGKADAGVWSPRDIDLAVLR